MKKRTIIIGLLVVFVVFFGLGVSLAVADGIKIESVSDLLSDRYPIANYRSYTVSNSGFLAKMTGDLYVNAIGGIGNLLYEFTKLIWELFDYFVKELYTMNLLDKLNGIIGELTGNMWNNFRNNYISIILIFSILYIVRTFIVESPKNAFMQFAKMCLVLIVSFVWFPRSSEYMSTMNDYSFMLQAEVISVAGQTDATNALATVNDNGQVNTATSNETATNVIRNELFKQVVYNPFLLLNYRTTDKNKINEMYKDIDDDKIPKNNNGEYLLSKEFSKLDDDEKISKLEELSEGNKTLTSDSVEYKLIISIISLLGVFLYGIPITVIAGLNMVLQLLAVVYSYILPIVALISLIPKYSNALIGSIMNIAKIFLGKGFLGLLVLLFSLVNLTIDLLVPPSDVISAIANTFLKGLIYWLAWHYKDKIVRGIVNVLTQRNGVNKFDFDMKQFNQGMNDFAEGEMTPSLTKAKDIDDIQEGVMDAGANLATSGAYGEVKDVIIDDEPTETEGQETNGMEVEGEFTEIPEGEMITIPEDSIVEIDGLNELDDISVESPDIEQLDDVDVTGGNEQDAQRRTNPQENRYEKHRTGESQETGQFIEKQIKILNTNPVNQTFNHQENNQEANIENNMNNYRIEKHTHKNEFQQKLRVLRSA